MSQPDKQANVIPENPADETPIEAKVPEGGKVKKEKKKKTVWQEILSWVLTLLAAVVIASLVRLLIFEPVRVDGGSMNTTLKNGEVMLVTKPEVLFHRLERGDVIICRFPDRNSISKLQIAAPLDISLVSHTLFVKRLVGLPGDTVAVQNGHLYLNDQMVDEPYVDEERFGGKAFERYTLGEDEYFVLGDNRAGSHDSRYAEVGPISGDMIVGHAKLVLLPLNKIRVIK